MTSFSEISTAFVAQLSGVQVTYQNQVTTVPVIPGLPEPEFTPKSYPAISVSLVLAEPDYTRRDILDDYFGYDETSFTVYKKPLPEPWNLTYQVDCFSRYEAHTNAMMEQVLRSMNRSKYLEVGTAALTSDVSEGDTEIVLDDPSGFNLGDILVLDKTVTGVLRPLTQGFFVLGTGSGGGVMVEPAAQGDFPAASSTCYKSRYELVYVTMLVNDGQDGTRPYARRTFQYEVWGNLDLESAEQVAAVAQVDLNLSVDYDRLVHLKNASPYKGGGGPGIPGM
jgi:hypothetical protein